MPTIKKFIFPGFLTRLSLAILIFSSSTLVSNLRTVQAIPVEEEKIIEVQVPEESKEPDEPVSPEIQSVKIEAKKAETRQQERGVCSGVSESWKLTPNLEEKGLYYICNAKNDTMATASELNNALNDYRAGLGLSRLNINSALCNIASNRAREIASNFSHNGFESAVKGSGMEKSSYGENIASGPMSAVRFVEWSWDKSPGHRENMRRDWTDGCGGVYDRYAVFLFAK